MQLRVPLRQTFDEASLLRRRRSTRPPCSLSIIQPRCPSSRASGGHTCPPCPTCCSAHKYGIVPERRRLKWFHQTYRASWACAEAYSLSLMTLIHVSLCPLPP